MKHDIKKSLSVLAILFSNSTYSVSESDFQFKATLITAGQHPMYQVIIPFYVYQGIKRKNLGDMRILNADGVQLPHAIRNIEIERSTSHKSLSLPLFPIHGNKQQNNKDLSVSIGKNASGTLVKVNSSKETARKSKVTMYIVDASQLKYNITALKFDWTSKNNSSVHSLLIEQSHDLKNWHTINKGTLSKLKYGGHQLNRDSININGQKARYLRVRWENINNGFLIKSIRAQYYNIKIKKPISPRSQTLFAKKVNSPNNDPQFVYYHANVDALIPISQIEFKLPYENMAVNAEILTKQSYWDYDYRGKKRSKQTRYKAIWKGVLYNITTNKGPINNKQIAIQLNGKRHFLIKLPKSAIPKKLEQLPVNLYWTPHKLLFIAQGSKPYTLVYGSETIKPSRFNFNSLAQMIKSTHGKTFKPQTALLGKSQKNPTFRGNSKTPQDTTDTTQWILWSVIILGVTFLGFMSRKISKQIYTSDE